MDWMLFFYYFWFTVLMLPWAYLYSAVALQSFADSIDTQRFLDVNANEDETWTKRLVVRLVNVSQ